MLPHALSFGILHAYSTLWMRSRAEVIVEGRENLPPAQGEHRVYLLLNHSTTFDVVALMHIAARPFVIMMDRGAFTFPVIRHVLAGARFVPLDKTDSNAAFRRCIAEVEAGWPLLISLHEGDSTLGSRERPRTGGLRLARMTGATLVPVFLYVEPDRIRHLRFRGINGIEYPYTTFRDTRYWIRFLPPVDLSSLPPDACYDDLKKAADVLDALADENEREFCERFAAEEALRGGSVRPRRRGGTAIRVSW